MYSEIFLIIEPSNSQRLVFPHWVFPGTVCPEITVTLSMCACAYSRSELVEICYVFCFDVNLNLFS